MRRPLFALTVVFAGAMISEITACGSDDATTPVAREDGDAEVDARPPPAREAGVDASARDASVTERDAAPDALDDAALDDAAPDAAALDAALQDAGSQDAGGPPPPFTNPTVPFSCPDPGVLADGPSSYFMVCTGGRFRIRASSDLVHWTETGKSIFDADKAPWSANGGRNWAPEIHKVGATYVAYFTAVNASDKLSIGAASATSPTGPYTHLAAPLVEDPLGVIDATFFEDTDGKRYLYYKIDGNSAGKPTPIYVRELASNGLSFAAGSSRTEVLTNDGATWEGGVVEAPWVIKRNGQYYLFYSGNVYDDRYRTGVARAQSVKGPFVKKGAPIVGNSAKWLGPGHGSVLDVNGKDWFALHAWVALPNGTRDGTKGREGVLAPIVWASGWPTIAGAIVPAGPIAAP